MINARGLYKIQKSIKEIIAYIESAPKYEEFLTGEWGDLSGTAPVKEVTFLKSNDEDLQSYIGFEGQVVYNKDTKILHIMDGETPGGIPVNTIGNSSKIVKKEITEDEWRFNEIDDIYEITVRHDLDLEIENLDLKFYVNDRFTLADYFYVDRNTVKILSTTNTNSTAIIKMI